MDSQIELYPHNQIAYDKLRDMLSQSDRACVIQPTGTGKFVIIAKLVQDNPDKRFLLLGTNDYMFIDQMDNLEKIAPGFHPDNLQFKTYSAAMVHARSEHVTLQYDYIILDEFHHCGAPEWSKGVQWFIDGSPDAKLLGFSATPIRFSDDGRNMANEIFEGNIASSEVFESIEEVEQELFDGRSGDEVGRAVRTGESVRGYHFYRADAPKPEPSFFGMKDWRCVEEKKVREPKSDAPHSLDDVGKTVLEALGVGIKDIDLDGLREFIARNAGEIKGERADGSETKTRDVFRETVSLKQTVRESREASTELSKKNTYTDGPSGKDEH